MVQFCRYCNFVVLFLGFFKALLVYYSFIVVYFSSCMYFMRCLYETNKWMDGWIDNERNCIGLHLIWPTR